MFELGVILTYDIVGNAGTPAEGVGEVVAGAEGEGDEKALLDGNVVADHEFDDPHDGAVAAGYDEAKLRSWVVGELGEALIAREGVGEGVELDGRGEDGESLKLGEGGEERLR